MSKPIKYYRNKADTLYQQIGSHLYRKCLICGGTYSCLHHFFTKGSSSALRYDLDNGIPICVKCHCKIHKGQDPSMIQKILQIKGQDWFNSLEKKRHQIIKTNIGYYKQVIQQLSDYLTNIL